MTKRSPNEPIAPPPPPQAPREITPAVLRQSLREPRVRFWGIVFLFLLIVTTWFITDQIHQYFQEKWLIANGVPVTAVVKDVGGESRPGLKFVPGSTCDLQFTFNGTPEIVTGTLNETDTVVNGASVQLRVEPDDPSVWTSRTEPESLLHRMVVLVVVLPIAVAIGFATLFLRKRVIAIWREGVAEPYGVVATYHTALAPRSHAVHCAPSIGGDQRVITVYLPGRLPRPQPGDVLWLVHPKHKPRAAIAAAAYQ
jgi:hypothetical protein